MKQVMDEYDGKVAWVYRHFPLDAIHSKARREAEATECAAELGGNEKFWAYIDRLFEITPSNNGLDDEELTNIAGYVGLNTQAFLGCLNSGRHKDSVAEDLQDALNSGGQGTPYSILIGLDGKKIVISGAQPYSNVKAIIDSAL
jgi:protein-disulfide isomerase